MKTFQFKVAGQPEVEAVSSMSYKTAVKQLKAWTRRASSPRDIDSDTTL